MGDTGSRQITYDTRPIHLQIMSSKTSPKKPLVAIIMGSQSDWETMRHSADQLASLGIPHECHVVSAHRTPHKMVKFAEEAEGRGLRVIIAGAGGAAHLPGMTAALTPLPVLGVPVESRTLKGVDSLLSIVQMPGGIPVGCLAVGKAGAINAGLLAASILATTDPALAKKLRDFREKQTREVLSHTLPPKPVAAPASPRRK
jgi:5-(carboxyamino)imidazole ribonucleotide mutase